MVHIFFLYHGSFFTFGSGPSPAWPVAFRTRARGILQAPARYIYILTDSRACLEYSGTLNEIPTTKSKDSGLTRGEEFVYKNV